MKKQLMRTGCLAAVPLIFTACAVYAQAPTAAPPTLITDTAPGWLWDDMKACDASGPPSVSAHAGGPGSSATFVFTGTGVTINGISDTTVKVNNAVHRVHHIKITIDGVVEGEVSDTAPGQAAPPAIFAVHNLQNLNHSLVLEAVDGWAAVSSLTIDATSASGNVAASASDQDAPVVPNGDFETPRLNKYMYNVPGAAWTFGGGAGGDLQHGTFTGGAGMAVPGDDFMINNSGDNTQVGVLQGWGSSYIAQRIYFPHSGKYVVTFLAAQRGSGSSTNKGGMDHEDFAVVVNGTVVGTYRPQTSTFITFTTKPFEVDAQKPVVLAFQGIDSTGDDETVLLDNVAISKYHP